MLKIGFMPGSHKTEESDEGKWRDDFGDQGGARPFRFSGQIHKKMEDIRRRSIDAIGFSSGGSVLHLKHHEGMLKYGRPTRPKSVTAEVGNHTKIESFTKRRRSMSYLNGGCRGLGAMIIRFEDNSNATVFASTLSWEELEIS